MTVYEQDRREIKLAILAIERAESALKKARGRLRSAIKRASETGSYAEIADVFHDAKRPVSRQRIEQIMKGGDDGISD